MTTPDTSVFTGEHLIDQVPPDGWEFVRVDVVDTFEDNALTRIAFRHIATGTVATGTVIHIAPIEGRTVFTPQDPTIQNPTLGDTARMTLETPDLTTFTGRHLATRTAPDGWSYVDQQRTGYKEGCSVESIVYFHAETGTHAYGVVHEDCDNVCVAFTPLRDGADPTRSDNLAKMTPGVSHTVWTKEWLWRDASQPETPVQKASRLAVDLRVLELHMAEMKEEAELIKAELAETLEAGQHDLGPVKVTVTVPKRLDAKAAAKEWTLEDHPEMWVCPDPKIDTKALTKNVAPVDLEPFKKPGAPIIKVVDQA